MTALLFLTSPPAHSKCRQGRERGRSIPFATDIAVQPNIGCWGCRVSCRSAKGWAEFLRRPTSNADGWFQILVGLRLPAGSGNSTGMNRNYAEKSATTLQVF